MAKKGPRELAASIDRRNGAWFISIYETTDADGDHTPDALYDCASSEATARRLARQAVIEMGWYGPFRWEKETGYVATAVWHLMATDNMGEDEK